MDTPRELADELTDTILDANPVAASLFGIRDREDRLPDYTEGADERQAARIRAIATRAAASDPAADPDRVTLAVVRAHADGELAHAAARAVEYTVGDSFFAPAVDLLISLGQLTLAEPGHAEGYLARLGRLPEVLAGIEDRHRVGVAAGRLPVRRLAEAAVRHFDRFLAEPAGDPLRRPQPPSAANGFTGRRDELLTGTVYPALARYRELVAAELVPVGRPDGRPGLCWLPDGPGYYAGLVRAHTTTSRTPEELHRVGREIVAALREEMAAAGTAAVGTGDVPEILKRLRGDPALRWRDGEEVLATARTAVARAEEAAPAWFGRLPRQQCVVAAVPAAEAPGAPGAYYLPPALDGTRPGTYYANTHRAEERDRVTAEAVAFHEAVPGHHFQLTLAQEVPDAPLLQRLFTFVAYAEGWGLYAERLADEMGLYASGLARLGMLSEQAVRASRLVVDTGLHAHGWSREQVVAYLRENTALPEVEIETEADRYIAAPGQALGYMVGKLEIDRMRAEAAEARGDRFDLRQFHDLVLGSGSLPLGALDELVRTWAHS